MLLVFIASTLVCSAAASVFSVFAHNASERLGSSAVLQCGLSSSLKAKTFEIRWYKNDYNNPLLLYKDLKVQENAGDPQYRGRVSLIGELEKGDVSLKLENLTLADRGEYVCLVKSVTWYDTANLNLSIKVLGSSPLFSLAEAGDQVNVSCASDGWSPKPTLIWRDKDGRDLTNSHTHYRTDSEGLVSVSSWLFSSRSESEWISCSVGLSDQEMVDSRVLPVKKLQAFWREAFISTLVLSLSIIILLSALLLQRQGLLPCCSFWENTKAPGLLPCCSFRENTKAAVNVSPAETLLLQDNTEENAEVSGNRPQPPVSTVSAQERLKTWNKLKKEKENLTVDPETCTKPLTTTRDRTSVYCGQLDIPNSTDPFPHVLSKEEFFSGQKYWEVQVDQKEKSKLSWCVGVTPKPPTKETLTALCYEEGGDVYTSTDPCIEIPTEDHVSILGLLLDFKHKTLSFYNVDKQSHLQTFTMNNMKNNTYCALISPGVKDNYPVRFQL